VTKMQKPKNLPSAPGVYQFLDKASKVLYLGKAKDLKKRVGSYFLKSKERGTRTQKMLEKAVKLKCVLVSSEVEALILEATLIKQLKPPYNIVMRDNKNYLYIKVTVEEDFPRVEEARQRENDQALYFGPKTVAGNVHKTLQLLKKIFPYRGCRMKIECQMSNVKCQMFDDLGLKSGIILKNKDRKIPCLDYHIGRCLAPCIGKCTKAEYGVMLQQIVEFLKGNYQQVEEKLESEMRMVAKNKNFEQAARLRDKLSAVRQISEKQRMVDPMNLTNQDVIHFAISQKRAFFSLFVVREGKVRGEENFEVVLPEKVKLNQGEGAELRSEVLTSFIRDYYQAATDFPDEILLPEKIEEAELVGKFLQKIAQRKVKLIYPQRGKKNQLLKLALKNAEFTAKLNQLKWEKVAAEKNLLESLRQELDLRHLPRRIEGYDISHLGGGAMVGARVVFCEGEPSSADYRHYRIKSLSKGEVDDCKALREILSRRFGVDFEKINSQEVAREHYAKKEPLPDLVLIDGGKGQLKAGMSVLKKAGLKNKVAVVALAKKEEALFLPGKKGLNRAGRDLPLQLKKDSPVLHLLQRVRDESHRFAISYNRNLRSKSLLEN